MVKKLFSRFYYNFFFNTSIDYRIRKFLKKDPIIEMKPWNSKSVISDLFLWRAGDNWITDFKLLNIASIIFPEKKITEHCEILVFDSSGNLLKTDYQKLQPLEMKNLKINDYIKNEKEGTFSIFHYSSILTEFIKKKSHLTERGYVAYSNKQNQLRSFCHGNLQSLSKVKKKNIKSVVSLYPKSYYYPQLILSDCDKIEIFYCNPTFNSQEIKIEFYDRENNKHMDLQGEVDPLGCKNFEVDNKMRKIHTFKNSGQIAMWRPLIFKNYKSHFDVIHG